MQNNLEQETPHTIDPSALNYINRYIENLKNAPLMREEIPIRELTSLICYGHEEESLYTLDTLLKIIEQAPENTAEENQNELFFRIGAIDTVVRAYNKELYKDPNLSKVIIDCLIRRRLKFNKEAFYTTDSKDGSFLEKEEVWKIISFFETATSKEISPENQLNLFQCLLDGKSLTDYSSACRETEIIDNILKKNKNNKALFLKLVHLLIKNDESYDDTDPSNYRAQYNTPPIYSTIFSLFKDLDQDVREEVEKTLFKRIIDTVKNHENDSIRSAYISPLKYIVSLPPEQFKNSFAQQVRMEGEILKTLTDVIKQEPKMENKHIEYTSLHIAYKTVAEMLDNYVEGVINDHTAQNALHNKYAREYRNAFDALVNYVPRSETFRRSKIKLLNKFINIDTLDNPRHPFRKKGAQFVIAQCKSITLIKRQCK